MCLLMAKDKAEELGIEPKMELKAFAYAGVKPEIMGIGPIPATHKALKVAGLTIDDIGLIELNEAFAVQAIAFMKEFGLQFPDDPRMNIYGGAIAFGHPLASSGVRLGLPPDARVCRASGREVRADHHVRWTGPGRNGHLEKPSAERQERRDKEEHKEEQKQGKGKEEEKGIGPAVVSVLPLGRTDRQEL